MNIIRNTLRYTLIILFLTVCISIPAIATTSSPAYPMILSGEIIIDGVGAPAGTIIEAKEGDKLLGTTTVQADGEYGNTIFNKLLVTKPDGASFDLYIQLPTMSSSMQVASIVWGSRDETFNIDINTGAGDTGTGDTGTGDTGAGDTGAGDTGAGDTGAGDTGTGRTSSGGGGIGSATITTKSKMPSVVETTSFSASTKTKEDTNIAETASTQSLKTEVEDTVFQTRDAATDNMMLSSILVIGFLAIALLGYMRYKES